jgi:hypothetical protein
VTAAVAAWLAGRAPHERVLLTAIGLAVIAAGILAAALAVRADLDRLSAAVASRERELAAVRRLAAELGPAPATTRADGPSLVTRLETAAGAVVGRQRIAAMTPASTPLPEGLREERVTLRLSGTSLAELVRLLHALGSAEPPVDVARLELRKHPDDARRFDASLEAARVVPAGEP